MATIDPIELLHQAESLHAARQFADAAASYRQALSLDSGSLDAWYGLGCCLLATRAYGAAAEALTRAVTLRPDADGARCNLAEALFQLGKVEAATRHYLQATDSADAEISATALDALAVLAPGSPALDNAAVLALRQRWASRIGRDIRPLDLPPRDPSRKLRIGYVSAFFGARNWMKPVFGVINHHDRDRFEIHMLSDGDEPSESSGYRDHDEDRIWRTANLSNEQLAHRIAEAGLDILVDLNGYTVQRRLPLFLYRPARRHIGWFNMYATTGLSAFDILVGDASVLPPEEEQFYCERTHRVPGSYLAFDVRYPVPDVTPPPCLTNGSITFGCLGSAYKLTDTTIAAWARILAASPNARLLLKQSSFADASTCDVLRARLGCDRVLFEGGDEHYAFLQAYARIDIALDTFPYNGGTTTTEALWQGVPVLTFNGDRWASRTSRSLLLAAWLPEWVSNDRDSYINAAIRLAHAADTPARLAHLRATMRARLQRSAACDTATLCRALEDLYSAA